MNPTNLPIKIEFEQTLAHTRDLMKSHLKSSKIAWIVGSVLILFWVSVILNGLKDATLDGGTNLDMEGIILSYVVPIGIIVILWIVIIKWIRKRSAKKRQENRTFGHREMIFDLKSFEVKTSTSETKYDWDAVLKKKESKLSYFLYVQTNQAIIVPKSAFQSAEAQMTFQELCDKRIGSAKRTMDSLTN